MRLMVLLGAVVIIAMAAMGCSGSGDASVGGAQSCTPGASVACVGPGGCTGGQACKEDGAGFTPCVCGGDVDGGAGDGAADGSFVEAGTVYPDGCVAATCAPGSCGSQPDGCGGTLSCGVCDSGIPCSSSCDDNNPCTKDTCSNGSCLHDPAPLDKQACPAGVCAGGFCTPCGQNNDVCCANETCNSGTTCVKGVQCVTCGQKDQPCCQSSSSLYCTSTMLTCVTSLQVGHVCACGGAQEKACNGTTCNAGLYLCGTATNAYYGYCLTSPC